MDELEQRRALRQVKNAVNESHVRARMQQKLAEPQTLKIMAEGSATDELQVAAALGVFIANAPPVVIHTPQQVKELKEKWESRPKEFESQNFSNELSSNLAKIEELERMSAEEAAREERLFLQQFDTYTIDGYKVTDEWTEEANDSDSIDGNEFPQADPGDDQELSDPDPVGETWQAIEEAPGVAIMCHDVCCCRVNCCENPEVYEQDGSWYCHACDDICEEPINIGELATDRKQRQD
jgi:hypothetical protein